jgi:hypothetical protein
MRIGVLVLLALLLGGCGSAGHPGHQPQAKPTTSATTATTAPDGNGPLVPDLSITPKPSAVTAGPATRLYGADLSWPQCPKGMGIPQKRSEGAPMPTAAARFVVIGLTNGPSFVANPCLADQVAWARARRLLVAAYAVLSYPDAATVARYRSQGPYDAGTRLGALRNTGYRAALFNLGTLKAAGLPTPIVWVDVEPVTGFDWSPDLAANAAVVTGAARGYRDAGLAVGFYSTPSLWKRVVGDLQIGGPEWRAAGERGPGEAIRRCADDWSFQGGKGVLGQWVEGHRDRNLTCPGAVPDPRKWFGSF